MKLLSAAYWGGARARESQILLLAVVAAAAAVTTGTAIAFSPELAAAGVAFILLLVMSRSREATVALWLVIRVLMFSGYVPGPVGEFALVAITILALARAASGGRLRWPRSHVLWLVLLGLVGLNLAYFGFDPDSQKYAIEIFFENFMLITLIANTKSRWTRDGAVTAVATVLVGIGIVAALEWTAGRALFTNLNRADYEARIGVLHTFEGVYRLGSVLLNPDLLAAAMVLGFVVWVGIALEERRLVRWISIACSVALLWVALLTLSRTVFLGVPAGLAFVVAFAIKGGRVSASQAGVAAASAAAAAVATLLVVPYAWLRVTANLVDPLRIGAYETAVRIITAHPFVGLGAGWNRYTALAEPYRVADQYRPLTHPHNSFLEFAAMLGLPVTLMVVLLVGRGFINALRAGTSASVSAIPVAGMVVMLVMSLVGNPITIPVLSNFFWALWAVSGQRSEPKIIPRTRPVEANGPNTKLDPFPRVVSGRA